MLAKLEQVINRTMLEAALCIRFKGNALEASRELIQQIEID